MPVTTMRNAMCHDTPSFSITHGDTVGAKMTR
jgi:hypothetical protein